MYLVMPVVERVAGEAAAAGGRERGLVGVAGSFGEPDLEDRGGGRGQRRDPVLPSFSGAADVWSGGELNVAASQAGEFGDAQPGLDGQDEQCVVASAGPGAAVGSVEQRLDLVLVEERDDRAVGPLERDREHAGDVLGVFGVAVLGVAEQRVDRRESHVAGADAVAALGLEVVEERGDQRRVELGDVELGWLASEPALRRSRAAAGACRGRRGSCAG